MRFLILILLLAVPFPAFSDGWGKWENARALYDAKKYREALNQLSQEPEDGPAYHYNLGNIYFRMGDFGRAAAHFQKARQSKPHDPDILHNLELAESKTKEQLGISDLDQASTSFERIGQVVPLTEAQAVMTLLALVTLFFWFKTYRRTRSFKAALIAPSGWIAIGSLLLTGFVYQARVISMERPAAVAVEPAAVHSGPNANFQQLTRLSPGVQLRLLGPKMQSGNETWVQVRFQRDGIGWVTESAILKL